MDDLDLYGSICADLVLMRITFYNMLIRGIVQKLVLRVKDNFQPHLWGLEVPVLRQSRLNDLQQKTLFSTFPEFTPFDDSTGAI